MTENSAEDRDPTEDDLSRADSLRRKRWGRRLIEDEAEWLARWEAEHPAPEVYGLSFGRSKEKDLGVPMSGPSTYGDRWLEGLATGNVHIAGNWSWHVWSVEENGWPGGFCAHMSGLAAFLDAFGADIPSGAEEVLGPFYDALGPDRNWEMTAYRHLAFRLLAALVHVSNAAFGASAEARAFAARQLEDYERTGGLTDGVLVGDWTIDDSAG